MIFFWGEALRQPQWVRGLWDIFFVLSMREIFVEQRKISVEIIFCVDWEISGLTRLISAVTDTVRSCCGRVLYWHQSLAKERAILTLGEPHSACGGSVYAWRDCMLICEAVFDCKRKHNQWGRTQRGNLLLYHSFQRSNWRGSVHFNTGGRIHCDLASF